MDVIVPEQDLVTFALLGLHKSWYGFQNVVNGKENFPNRERLWIDYIQEEIWSGTRDGTSTKTEDEENFALASKANNKNGKREVESSQKDEKKKDLIKIKFFHYHEFGHYATNCPNWNKGSSKNNVVASVELDVFASQLEKDFSMIACMASSKGSSM